MRKLRHLLICRWRALSAVGIGILANLVMHQLGLRPATSALIGWDTAAFWFVITTYWALLTDDEVQLRRRAAREDESGMVILTLILSAVIASLFAIVMALRESKAAGHDASTGGAGLTVFLSASTLLLSWLVVQALFTLHYAHRWFGGGVKDTSMERGILFVGDPPKTYRDFLYVAICVGATCQGSDFGITNTRFRNLVTVHALTAFIFNTMVLALGINILASLLA